MPENPLSVLQNTFGYDAFRDKQEAIIQHVIGGGDALVLMPTGGGKSLCYQIPAICRPGLGLIVSPLIALMHDQVSALQQNGVRAAYLNSSLSSDESYHVLQQISNGELDLLYAAPERIVMESFLDRLGSTHMSLIAIDEAHCISRWGHDFRPEYLQMKILGDRFPHVPRIALTATADSITRQEILDRLQLSSPLVSVSAFDRPNIRYTVGSKDNPRRQLLRFLENEHPTDAGIVYCLSRRSTEQTAEFLRDHDFKALAYHAGLRPEVRKKVQERFLREDGLIVVATIAFGMGIDKPDVRFVAHLDLPKSMEAYYQETGRAGRDGKPANAWMVYGMADVVFLKKLMAESEAEESFKRIERSKLDYLLAFCESTECRRKIILEYFDDTFVPPCNNCDSCLEPQAQWDGTKAAQMALSAIYRTGQRFGVGYLVDILIGKETERSRQFGHTDLITFGVGAKYNKQEWTSIFRQLTAGGYLRVDVEGYGGLQLNATSTQVLRGEKEVFFRKDPVQPHKSSSTSRSKSKSKTKSKKRSGSKQSGNYPNTPENNQLFEALRACRKTIAQKSGLAPFMIFHDSALTDMVAKKPKTLEDFREVSGVGETKLERYGADFIAVVKQSC